MTTRKLIGAKIFKVTLVASLLSLATLSASAGDDLLNLLGQGASSVPGQDGVRPEARIETQWLREILKKEGRKKVDLLAEQNILEGFFSRAEYEKALFQWPVAVKGSELATSSNGQAIYGYLLFKNGLQIAGLERLLSIQDPKKIDAELLKSFRDAASIDLPVWNHINVKWNNAWTAVFGIAAEVHVVTRQSFDPENLELLKDLAQKTALDTKERAMVEWQLALGFGLKDDASSAAKILTHMFSISKNSISPDLMNITAARLLYQNGFLLPAISYYQKVSKASDYWLDAQEEIGWAHIRRGEPQDTLAVTKTLIAPIFDGQIGPETVFLRSLAQLKVCDYPGAVESIKLFRERFRARAQAMLNLKEDANTPVVQKFIAKTKQQRQSLNALGADVHQLPRFITRDEWLNQLVGIESATEAEAKVAADLYARSLTGGTAQVGFQASIDEFRKDMDLRVARARSATLNRIKELATDEVDETSKMLSKMHIVEAEILQQISVSQKVIQASSKVLSEKKGSTGSQARDKMVFPFDGETWMDELSNYKVDIKKGCQAVNK